MTARFTHLVPQPLVGALVSLLGLIALLASRMSPTSDLIRTDSGTSILVAVFLMVVFVAAGEFPVHVRYHTKVYMQTVPLYLMAVLLPLPLAGLAAGVSVLVGQLLKLPKTRNLPSDIATAVGRWVIVVLMAAVFAHVLVAQGLAYPIVLFGSAVAMFVGDMVTCALEIAPMCGEPPFQVVAAAVQEAGVVEGVQYLLGILGALVAIQNVAATALLVVPIGFVYLAFKNRKEMQASTQQLLESLADTVDLRDPYTGGHSRRVTDLSRGILRELGISGHEADLIIAAARVHDIGKIGIPDEILRKPGRLTPEEWAIMSSHPAWGAELLARYGDFARGALIVRHHHERWDGQGYPDGLEEFDIPFGARVIAVADSFDAMTSDRPYRHGMSADQAASILRTERGRQWDPTIVDAFLSSIADQLETATKPLPQAGFHPGESLATTSRLSPSGSVSQIGA